MSTEPHPTDVIDQALAMVRDGVHHAVNAAVDPSRLRLLGAAYRRLVQAQALLEEAWATEDAAAGEP